MTATAAARRQALLAFAPAVLALALLPLWPAEPTYASAGLVPRTLGVAWAGLLALRGAWGLWMRSAATGHGARGACTSASPWLALLALPMALSPSTALLLAVPAAAGLVAAAALAWGGPLSGGPGARAEPAPRLLQPWLQAVADGVVLTAGALALAWAPRALGDTGAVAAALLAGLAGVHGAAAALAAVHADGQMDITALPAALVAAMGGGAFTSAAVAWRREGGREGLRVLLGGVVAAAAAGGVATWW